MENIIRYFVSSKSKAWNFETIAQFDAWYVRHVDQISTQ